MFVYTYVYVCYTYYFVIISTPLGFFCYYCCFFLLLFQRNFNISAVSARNHSTSCCCLLCVLPMAVYLHKFLPLASPMWHHQCREFLAAVNAAAVAPITLLAAPHACIQRFSTTFHTLTVNSHTLFSLRFFRISLFLYFSYIFFFCNSSFRISIFLISIFACHTLRLYSFFCGVLDFLNFFLTLLSFWCVYNNAVAATASPAATTARAATTQSLARSLTSLHTICYQLPQNACLSAIILIIITIKLSAFYSVMLF